MSNYIKKLLTVTSLSLLFFLPSLIQTPAIEYIPFVSADLVYARDNRADVRKTARRTARRTTRRVERRHDRRDHRYHVMPHGHTVIMIRGVHYYVHNGYYYRPYFDNGRVVYVYIENP